MESPRSGYQKLIRSGNNDKFNSFQKSIIDNNFSPCCLPTASKLEGTLFMIIILEIMLRRDVGTS